MTNSLVLFSTRNLAGPGRFVSRELADDSNPAAANVVGQGLARDIARRVDRAFYSLGQTE